MQGNEIAGIGSSSSQIVGLEVCMVVCLLLPGFMFAVAMFKALLDATRARRKAMGCVL